MPAESDRPMCEPWRVQVLGAFRVARQGAAASFRTRKTEGLFAYLAFYAGRPIAKDMLADAFWPDATSDRARQSLRMALSSIRQSLGGDERNPDRYLVAHRDSVELWTAELEVDVIEFRRLAESARAVDWRSALALYGGPLLPSSSEPWILPQALELEELYAATAARWMAVSPGEEAIALGRRALALHPHREDLYIALMRAHAALGQKSAAIRAFEDLEQMLDAQWGETPGAEAIALLDSLPQGGAATGAASSAVRVSEPDPAPFFGRDDEIAELADLLDPRKKQARLITVTGLGGTGKTRLARRILERSHAQFERAWFGELVGAVDRAGVLQELLSSMGVPLKQHADAEETAGRAIGTSACLLVLDNAENVLGEVRDLANDLLNRCPDLAILATSRIPIGAVAERVFPLGPFELPSDFRDLNALRDSPSVRLLVEAAQPARPGFALTRENAQSVWLLCQKLEGLPLAIELAAAKLSVLSPAQVLASLARRLDLSTSKESVHIRHRSLQRIVEWSLALLSEPERQTFAILGICRGGFTHDLALSLAGPGVDEHVQKLSSCSLLHWREADQELRFEMLETVREMALGNLESDPVRQRWAYERMFEHFARICLDESSHVEPGQWVHRLARETGNLQVALEAGVLGFVDSESAWRVAFSLLEFMDRYGRSHIWIGPLEKLLEATRASLTDRTLALAHLLLGRAHYGVRDIREAYRHFQSAIEPADQSGEAELGIQCRIEFVVPAMLRGRFELAREEVERAAEVAESLDNPKLSADCWAHLGLVRFGAGEDEESEPICERAVTFARLAGDPSTLAFALTFHGCAMGQTKVDAARAIFAEAIELRQRAGRPDRLAHCHYLRALMLYRNRLLEDAHADVARAFRIYLDNGIRLGQTPLTICGNLMAAKDEPEAAATCWAVSELARIQYGMQTLPTLERDYLRELPAVRSALGPGRMAEIAAAARSLSDEELDALLFGN